MLGMGYDGLNVSHIPQNTRKLRDCKTQVAEFMQAEGARVVELKAGPIINRMRDVAGVRTDIALGSYLGLKTSAVSGWRNRDKVPYEECVFLAGQKGVSLDWLLLGLGERELSAHGVAGSAASEDARLARLSGFLATWFAARGEDDKAWLEMQLARAVPEYAEWVASRGKS